jgi:hypothetical protein
MKQLACEMCGSTDLIKQDGVFVCQTCGCKYSIEEAKKMMVEGTVEVTGTVRVDNSAAIANYLKMAKSALEANNHKEAEEYANKIIELEPQHCEAWTIKGEAAGWQSTGANPRLSDAVTAWLNAIEYADGSIRSQLREEIANKYTALMLAMIKLRCKSFVSIQSDENKDDIKSEIKGCIDLMDRLMTTGGVSFNRGYTYDQIAKSLNESAVAGYKDAQSDFGPEHNNMSKWQWERFTGSCDNCLNLLSFALNFVRDASYAHTICDNLVTIGEMARDSCSWKFDVNSWHADKYDVDYSFTSGAKEIRTEQINKWKSKKTEFCADSKQKTLKVLQGSRIQEEEERARRQYWEAHSSEMEMLNSETASLESHKTELLLNMSSLPILADIKKKQEEIGGLNKTLSGLGFFKGKEKKALQEQISTEKGTLKNLEEQREQQEAPIQSELSSIETRLKEIEEELSKSRGRVPFSEEHFVFENAWRDGKLTITPNMLFQHIQSIIPEKYEVSMEASTAVPIEGLGKTQMISFKDPVSDNEDGKVGVSIFLCSETADSPISAIYLPARSSCAVEFCKEASYILMSLSADKSILLDDVENALCDIVYSKEKSLFAIGEFRVEYTGYILVELMGVSLTAQFGIIRLND